jgi:hypothetical protein
VGLELARLFRFCRCNAEVSVGNNTVVKKQPKATKATRGVIQKLNAGLETFNDKSAMNFDGPGTWRHWIIDAVETRSRSHLVKFHAGKHKTTVKVPSSIELVAGKEASTNFIAHVTDVLMDSLENIDHSDAPDDDRERVAAPVESTSDFRKRMAREEREKRELAARVALLEREEQEAKKAPSLSAFQKALKKEWADDFQALLEKADGALTKRAIELMFSKQKDADFVAEAIRPNLRSVKLTRKQWAFVATARFASSVVRDYAESRS